MEWIIAVCSAGLNLAAVWLVQKKTGLKPEKQTQWAAALLLAAAGGFASGYMLVLRAGTYPPNLLRLVLLGTLLTAAAYIDALSHKIPNWIVLCTAAVFAGCTVLDFVLSGTDAVPMALNSVLAAAVFLWCFPCAAGVTRRRWIWRHQDDHGSGADPGNIRDIQLFAGFACSCGGGSHCTAGQQKATRKDGLPFGPFFYLGYLVTILAGMF